MRTVMKQSGVCSLR